MEATQPLRILFVEDLPSDVELAERELRKQGISFTSLRVDTKEAFLDALKEYLPDVIISDYSMPKFNGMQALLLAREYSPALPFILFTGSMNEETAVACMKAGATDYVIKEQMARLPFAVLEALEQKKNRQAKEEAELALRESEARFRLLAENAQDMIWRYEYTPRRGFIYVSPAATTITGYTPEEYYADPDLDLKIVYPEDRPLLEAVERGETPPGASLALRWVRKDGALIWTEQRMVVIHDDAGVLMSIEAIVRDVTERKKAEEALKNSEKRFRALIENGLDNISLLDAEGTLLWESPAVIRTLGYTPDEFISRSVFELVHPDDSEWTQAIFAGLLREPGSRMHGALRLRHSDDSWRWVEAVITNLLDEPSVKAIVINYRDITERRQAEEALRSSEQRYRALFEDTPVAIWEQDFSELKKHLESLKREGVTDFKAFFAAHPEALFECTQLIKITDTNKAAVQMYRAGSKEVLIQSTSRDLTKGEWEHLPEDFSAIAEGRTSHTWEGTDETLTGDPIEISLSWSAAPGHEQDFSKVMVTTIDVTARKRAEAQLQLQSAALNAAANAIIITDSSNTIEWVNPAFLALTGYTSEDVVGNNLQELVRSGVHDNAFYQNLWDTTHAGDVWRGEIINRRKDGSLLTVDQTITPLRGPGGVINHFITIQQDITQRKQAEESVHRQLSRLAALHTIDATITASLDLRLALNAVLKEAIDQLNADAASILLLNPHRQTLEYAAGSGFRSDALQYTSLRLGDGFAGRAVVERRLINIPDLRNRKTGFLRSPHFSAEGFVAYYAIPLIAKGEVKGVLEVFHRAPLTPEPEWLNFLETLAGQAAIAIDNAQLFDGLQSANLELSLAYNDTIEGWSRALDLRDKETEGHTQRVAEKTMHLAQAMGFPEEELIHVRRGALLHDIGKMGVPDSILLKPGPLTDEEWVVMRRHTTFAYDLLSPIHYLRPALDIPYCHHEKWDGSGYPRGLKGDEIPLTARIFAGVDVWDALTSDRPYRPAWSKEAAYEYIREQKGKHFDPKVVDEFVRLLGYG